MNLGLEPLIPTTTFSKASAVAPQAQMRSPNREKRMCDVGEISLRGSTDDSIHFWGSGSYTLQSQGTFNHSDLNAKGGEMYSFLGSGPSTDLKRNVLLR